MATRATQAFDFFCVLDFEATCKENDRSFPNEIIEFPTVLVDAKTLTPVAEFREFVKPTQNPILTDFCTKLTGITQEQVDSGILLKDCLAKYHKWLQSMKLIPSEENPKGSAVKWTFITCGDWDLNTMLKNQCTREGIPVPDYFYSWSNLKKEFSSRYNMKCFGMAHMLEVLKMPLIGRHHSGIDDCRNIAAVAIRMMQDGHKMQITTVRKKKK